MVSANAPLAVDCGDISLSLVVAFKTVIVSMKRLIRKLGKRRVGGHNGFLKKVVIIRQFFEVSGF